MDFGKLIGQVLQQGMNQQSRGRVEHSLGNAGLGGLLGQMLGGGKAANQGAAGGQGGAGLGQVLGGMLGGSQSGAARGTGGLDLGGLLGGMLGGGKGAAQAGGGGLGGLGGLLGSMLGGGASQGGRAGGSAGMAILASLAMAALKNWQGGSRRSGALGLVGDDGGETSFDEEEFARLTSVDLEELMLRAMISATKADGIVDEEELQRIVGRMAEDGLSDEEKQFIVDELHRPLDLPGLIAAVPNQAVGAEVYAASLLAIKLDTEAEHAYLRQLAQGLGLEAETVSRLHQLTGAPA